MTVISPLTAGIDAGGFDITALDEVAFSDAAANASAAGRLRRNGTRITWHNATAAANLVTATSTDTLTNKTLGATSMDTNAAFTPAAVSGTPAQHALFRENTPKGWVRCDYAGSVSDSFNVTSVTDNGTGDTTVTWDRDFANATYAPVAEVVHATVRGTTVSAVAAGTTRVLTYDPADSSASDGTTLVVVAHGDQ